MFSNYLPKSRFMVIFVDFPPDSETKDFVEVFFVKEVNDFSSTMP